MGSIKDAPAPVVVAPAWSGLYFGGSVGWGHNRSTNEYYDSDGASSSVKESANGGLVSSFIGLDRQIGDRFVLGAFLEYDLSRLARGSEAANDALKIDQTLYIGGRLGVLMRPDVLVYATAGYARAHIDNEGWWDLDVGPGKDSQNFNGYFVGGGAEILLRGNFSLRGEVRYANFGSEITNSGTSGGLTYVDSEDPSIWTARIGLAYRFNPHRRHVVGGMKDGGDVEGVSKPVISYFGFDIGQGYRYGYSGSYVALNGDWDRSGFVFRNQNVIGRFDYAGIPGADALDISTDVMIGYQLIAGQMSVLGFVGMEVRDIDMSPDDPTVRLRGTETGFKVAGEIETGDEAPYYFNLEASYSTAFDVFHAMVRGGPKWNKIAFGPEGSFLREAGDDYFKVGGFVMVPLGFLRDWNANLTMNGGYEFVDNGNGASGRGGNDGGYFSSKLVVNF